MIYDVLAKNWFDLVQSAFIIIGFLLTIYSIRNDTRSRKVEHLMEIMQSHRGIWEKIYTHPELLRIKETDIDLRANPVTESERRFVIEVIMHIYLVYEAIGNGLLNKGEMEKDITEYLQLPIPNIIWHDVKRYQDIKFVSYIDKLLSVD